MLRLINEQRELAGLKTVRYDSMLLPIAQIRSTDMATRNYFSHLTPDGTDVYNIIEKMGYHFDWCSEIIARNNYPDDQTVSVAIKAFMDSRGHKAQIVFAPYTRAAVAEATSDTGVRYYVVIFATEK
jgi:uncharacterized protein YkwD